MSPNEGRNLKEKGGHCKAEMNVTNDRTENRVGDRIAYGCGKKTNEQRGRERAI